MMETKHTRILNEAETRKLIADTDEGEGFLNSREKWQVASEWLADLMDEREKTDGFQYNSSVMLWLEAREGWPKHAENASVLSILVYTTQDYRRQRAKRRAGYAFLDRAMIEAAIARKAKITVWAEGVFGDSRFDGRPKILADNSAVVFCGKSRTKGWRPDTQVWAKIG